MKEIRIYHSLWKSAPVILICFAFAALGIRTLVVHSEKMEDANCLGRIVRRFNQRIGGSQEYLNVSDMTMKPQELCDLLNERVKKMKYGSKNQE